MADDDPDYLDRIEETLEIGDSAFSRASVSDLGRMTRDKEMIHDSKSKAIGLDERQLSGAQRLATARSIGVEGARLIYAKTKEAYQWHDIVTGRFTKAPEGYPSRVYQSDTNYKKYHGGR